MQFEKEMNKSWEEEDLYVNRFTIIVSQFHLPSTIQQKGFHL